MKQASDDFFAPRPKLSWNVRVIRAAALLIAIAISLFFFIDGVRILNISYFSYSEKAFHVLAYAVLQLLLLVPCWRAWLLHRWACSLLTYILLLASFSAIVSIFGLGIIGFLFTASLLIALDDEEPHLKSGF